MKNLKKLKRTNPLLTILDQKQKQQVSGGLLHWCCYTQSGGGSECWPVLAFEIRELEQQGWGCA